MPWPSRVTDCVLKVGSALERDICIIHIPHIPLLCLAFVCVIVLTVWIKMGLYHDKHRWSVTLSKTPGSFRLLQCSRRCSHVGIRWNLTTSPGTIPPYVHLVRCVSGQATNAATALVTAVQSEQQANVQCARQPCTGIEVFSINEMWLWTGRIINLCKVQKLVAFTNSFWWKNCALQSKFYARTVTVWISYCLNPFTLCHTGLTHYF